LDARADMSREEIVDLVCALLSVHLYRELVLAAGWTAARYEHELGRQIRQAVLNIDAPSHDNTLLTALDRQRRTP
ncbi:MAG TPA: hypothetical protein VIN65_06755, partial [Candidatus Dormibacteraeota bacterium]